MRSTISVAMGSFVTVRQRPLDVAVSYRSCLVPSGIGYTDNQVLEMKCFRTYGLQSSRVRARSPRRPGETVPPSGSRLRIEGKAPRKPVPSDAISHQHFPDCGNVEAMFAPYPRPKCNLLNSFRKHMWGPQAMWQTGAGKTYSVNVVSTLVIDWEGNSAGQGELVGRG